MPKLSIDDLRKLRESSKQDIYLREGDFKGKIIVHLGTCGIAAGAREIMRSFLDELENRNTTDIMFTTTGCAGLCSQEPMVTIEMRDSAPVRYGKLSPDKVKRIFEENVIGGKVVPEFVLGIGSERVA